MTTNTKPEYVTDVEHTADCEGDRSRLCLVRDVIQVITPEFYSDDGGDFIAAGSEWEYEDSDPVRLVCNSCEGTRYVVIDNDANVIAMTRDNCPRTSRAYGHFLNYDRTPCKYCGYAGKGGAS